jgi:hypothetical protein
MCPLLARRILSRCVGVLKAAQKLLEGCVVARWSDERRFFVTRIIDFEKRLGIVRSFENLLTKFERNDRILRAMDDQDWSGDFFEARLCVEL